jgi:hypothetical protein
MAKKPRRTIEQLIEDKKKELAALESRAAVTVESKPIKAIVNEIDKVASESKVEAKAVLKLVSSVLSSRKAKETTAENAV